VTTSLTIALAVWAAGVQLNELVAAIGCYATAALVLLQVRPTLGDLKRWWPLIAFVAWGLAVPLLAGRTPTGSGVARLCDWLLVPVAAAAVTRVRLRPVLIAAGVTAALSCLAAALQHFGLWPSEEALAPLAFTRIPFSRVYELVPGSENRFMAGGLAFHRLRFANVTGLVVIAASALALGIFVGASPRSDSPLTPSLSATRGERLAAAVLAAFGFVCVAVFPLARAAAAALALSVATLVRPRWLAVAIIGVAAVTGMWTRPTGERLGLLSAGVAAVEQHPLAGTGLGRFVPGEYAPAGASDQVLEHTGKSHDQFVTLAAEGGIAHALLFLILLAWLTAWFYRAAPSAARTTGLAGVAFLVLLSLLHDPLFHAVTSQAVTLLLGACVGLCGHSRPLTEAGRLR
jgi:hypothetical protein